MKAKDAFHMLANRQTNRSEKGKRKVVQGMTPREGKTYARNYREDALIDALDNKEFLLKYRDWIEKLQDGQIDVQQFLSAIAPDAAVALAKEAFGGESAKIRVDAQKDLLDRAGFSKVSKVAVASIDPSAPKSELLSLIEGLNKKTKAMEITDDDDNNEDKADEEPT